MAHDNCTTPEMRAQLTAAGFQDWSYGNDMCARFVILTDAAAADPHTDEHSDGVITLWIDYPNPEDREDPCAARFTVSDDAAHDYDDVVTFDFDLALAIESALLLRKERS